MLDVTDRLVVIVGGGAVAVRKVKGLLEAGATHVRVVSPAFHDELPDAAAVERVYGTYEPKHLDDASLVFAVTDLPKVNERVAQDAKARGIWVNRSDEGDEGDFATPAKWAAGELIVTVSASSAALSAAIRDELADKLDRRFVKLADAMKTLRPAVRTAEADPHKRAAIFRDLASNDALAAVDVGGVDGLRDWIRGRYPGLKFG
jgi:siroheme synthase-like protein